MLYIFNIAAIADEGFPQICSLSPDALDAETHLVNNAPFIMQILGGGGLFQRLFS